MQDSIEIWIVITIAAAIVIASLLMTSLASKRQDALRDRSFRLLTLTNIVFLIGVFGLMLGPVLPFWLGASMVILGMHFGIVIGYMALKIGAGHSPPVAKYLIWSSGAVAFQGALAAWFQDVGLLVISSSLINGVLGLALARRLRRMAIPLGPELALLSYAPFAAIGLGYLLRFGLVLMDATPHILTVSTMVITFLVAFSALVWSFALIAFRATKLNRQLETALEKSEEASRLKSRFLSNISHELRTPLNGVLGMAQALEQEVEPPAQKQMLGTIRQSGEGLLAILNNILDVSQIQTDGLVLERQVFDLDALISRVAEPYRRQAEEKGLAFALQGLPLKARHRLGDPNRLQQILDNLLSNAVKFTSSGKVGLRISADETRLRATITDTGIGMSKQTIATMYDEFEQADNSATRRFDGMGLGMPIVKKLVEAMGGRIIVKSAPDKGTTLKLELPLDLAAQMHDIRGAGKIDQTASEQGLTVLQPATQSAPSDPGAREAAPSHPPTDAQDTTHLLVLVAEDNKVNQKVLSALLRDAGLSLHFADNGAIALEMSRNQCFDLLLFDIMMPEMDGLSALETIRVEYQMLGKPMPPAIAVTANTTDAQVAEYLKAGFADVVAKPVRKARLLEVLEKQNLHVMTTAA